MRHQRYGYRGVIVAADKKCQASDEWYQGNQTQPDREQPWYHVLVDGTAHSTYVAESNLQLDTDNECVLHPWINDYFESFTGEHYVRNDVSWPHGAP